MMFSQIPSAEMYTDWLNFGKVFPFENLQHGIKTIHSFTSSIKEIYILILPLLSNWVKIFHVIPNAPWHRGLFIRHTSRVLRFGPPEIWWHFDKVSRKRDYLDSIGDVWTYKYVQFSYSRCKMLGFLRSLADEYLKEWTKFKLWSTQPHLNFIRAQDFIE